jgi:hypothetical protein
MKLQKFSGKLTCFVSPSEQTEAIVAQLIALGWEVIK